MIKEIKAALRESADPQKATFFPRFFKAGPGEYAEGDKFLGVTVPKQRIVAKQFYKEARLEEITKLLESPWHEDRLTALLLLVLIYQKKDQSVKQSVVKAYVRHMKFVNNWDLVDSSAPYILGDWLLDKDKAVLYKLAKSPSLWERRIAIVATLWFIRKGKYNDTLALAEQLLHDKHDLIHKAVGWCLREVGKRDSALLSRFLDKHATHMPRTALRYAIERLSDQQRRYYLNLQ